MARHGTVPWLAPTHICTLPLNRVIFGPERSKSQPYVRNTYTPRAAKEPTPTPGHTTLKVISN